MSVFPGWEEERGEREMEPAPHGIDAFAHVEGLVREEDTLLAIEEHQREDHHHRRLAELRDVLDRLHDLLSERARRRG